jgi:hypothetical protein
MPCFTATVNCFVFSFFTESGFSRPEILIHNLKQSRNGRISRRARLTSFLNDDRNNPRQGGQPARDLLAIYRSSSESSARRSSAQRLRRARSETVSKVSEGRVIRDPDSSNAPENGGACNSPLRREIVWEKNLRRRPIQNLQLHRATSQPRPRQPEDYPP